MFLANRAGFFSPHGYRSILRWGEVDMRRAWFIAFCAVVSVAFGTEAWAKQAFIASKGKDANACTRVAPCKSLQRGVNVAGAGGEVIVLDSTTVGAVTIAKSVSIVASPGVQVSLAAPAAGGANSAVTISGDGIRVLLRGLTITADPVTPQNSGVLVQQADAVTIENCVIKGFAGYGVVSYSPGVLAVTDSTVRDNGSAGIAVGTDSGTSRTRAVLDRVRATRNGSGYGLDAGIAVDAGADATIVDCLLADNFRGIAVSGRPGASATAVADNCVVTHNTVGVFVGSQGLGNTGAESSLGVSRSSIVGNTLFGIEEQSGSKVTSYGDNTVRDNAAGEIFGATLTKK